MCEYFWGPWLPVVPWICPVANLGFRKGGPNFLWPLLLTQSGGQTMFSFFFYGQNWFFFCQRGAMANVPPKYATRSATGTTFLHHTQECSIPPDSPHPQTPFVFTFFLVQTVLTYWNTFRLNRKWLWMFISWQVLSAMNYLEGLQYMLHRDLAARNFLVGDDMCIKLADFGRARHVVDDYYQAPRTEKICIKWASPEVLVDSRYSTKSDVWAAGVVFWEIFSTGERPYASLSGEQTAVYVTEGGRLDKPPRCPPDLYSMMKKCWRDDPDERPSFSQLYDKLKSKSSIYYCCPVRPLNQNRNSNNLDTAKQMSPAPGKGKTPTSTKSTGSNAAVIRQKFSNGRYAQRDVSDSYGNGLDYYVDHNIPTSSSETSIISISGLLDGDKDDLTRGDKIRKSLRKLMKMKSTKRKPNSKTELRRSAKSVPAVQLYSTSWNSDVSCVFFQVSSLKLFFSISFKIILINFYNFINCGSYIIYIYRAADSRV